MTNMRKEEAIRHIQNIVPYVGGNVKKSLDMAINVLGAIDQIQWERDTAIAQLKELGYSLGEKIEPCEDVISRRAVLNLPKKTLHDYFGETVGDVVWIDDIIRLPSINSTKIGYWICEESIYGCDKHSYQCSVCGRSIHLDRPLEDLEDYPYCHCGAKMAESEKKNETDN